MFTASHPPHNIFLLTVVILAGAPLHECFSVANGTVDTSCAVDFKVLDA
jgi:hypothetical protein